MKLFALVTISFWGIHENVQRFWLIYFFSQLNVFQSVLNTIGDGAVARSDDMNI